MFTLSLDNLIEHPLFLKSMLALLMMLLIFLTIRFTEKIVSGKITDKDLRYRARKIIGLAGYLLTLFVAIIIFSDQMSNLAVIIGALSVGIGFALREVIQSLIGWGVISFGGIYKTGDRVQLAGVMGDVMDIGPLTTTIMECGVWVKSDLYNGRIAHVSNSFVLREHVFNYTADFPFIWDELVVPVTLNSDHQLARQLIEKIGHEVQGSTMQQARLAWQNFVHHYRIDDEPLAVVVTMSFDANWMEFTLRYLVNGRVRRDTKDKLYTQILMAFETTQGKVQIAVNRLQLAYSATPPVFPITT